MRNELDEALVRDFPNLYGDRHAPMDRTAMCWGIAVGDGWEPLIRELSEKLEAIIVSLPEEQREHIKASQVKEKWGGLRFYMTAATDEMWQLISEAERNSFSICEKCGAPGVTREGSWISTLCDAHANGRPQLRPWYEDIEGSEECGT